MASRHAPRRRPPLSKIAHSVLGAFLGLGAVAALEQFWFDDRDLSLMVGSFGASAVLLYAAAESSLAQPYNLMVGHGASALVGVGIFMLVGEASWLSVGLAGALAVAAMQVTRSLHPPGGATALIAVVGSDAVHALGFWYVVFPVLSGAAVMLVVALVVNNLPGNRPATGRWPVFWWPFSH